MKTILYATDYSDNSIAALKLAYALSKKLHTGLVVLHVFDIDVTLVSPVSITYARLQKETFKKHRKNLTEFCATHLEIEPDGEKLQIAVDDNSLVWDGILEQCEEFGAELIVVGMKGGSKINEILYGSTPKNLITRAPCPILAVPENMAKLRIEHIIYATAFEQADIYAIEKLVDVYVRPLGATLHMLHILTKKEYAGEDQMEWFKEMLEQKVSYANMNFELLFSEDIFGTLTTYVSETNVDLLVLLEREGQGFLPSLTHRSLVKRMTSENIIPLLSFNKKYL
ncbi:MAG: universal stress protein [Saonia sp.]